MAQSQELVTAFDGLTLSPYIGNIVASKLQGSFMPTAARRQAQWMVGTRSFRVMDRRSEPARGARGAWHASRRILCRIL